MLQCQVTLAQDSVEEEVVVCRGRLPPISQRSDHTKAFESPLEKSTKLCQVCTTQEIGSALQDTKVNTVQHHFDICEEKHTC